MVGFIDVWVYMIWWFLTHGTLFHAKAFTSLSKKVMLPGYIVVTISLVAVFRILDFSQNVRFDERPHRKWLNEQLSLVNSRLLRRWLFIHHITQKTVTPKLQPFPFQKKAIILLFDGAFNQQNLQIGRIKLHPNDYMFVRGFLCKIWMHFFSCIESSRLYSQC